MEEEDEFGGEAEAGFCTEFEGVGPPDALGLLGPKLIVWHDPGIDSLGTPFFFGLPSHCNRIL